MKKILTGIVALVLMFTTVASAAEYKISVPDSEQVQEGTYEEEIKTIDVSLMVSAAVLGITDTKSEFAQIKVESKSDKPVVATLKLELPEDKVAEGESAIDYMDLKIATSDKTVVFDETEKKVKEETKDEQSNDDEEVKETEETEETENKDKNKQEILLGIINEDGKDYTETFDIQISANKDIKLVDVTSKLTDVVWTVELNSKEDVVAAAKKVIENENDADADKPTKTINVTVDKTTEIDKGKLAAGEYTFNGIGKCTINTADGELYKAFNLSEKESEAESVTLKEGYEIIITGGEDAKLIPKAKTAVTQKPSSSTTRNTYTTSRNTTPTTSRTSSNATKSAASKANPKTGDNSVAVPVSVVALMAMAAMVYVVNSKKRED